MKRGVVIMEAEASDLITCTTCTERIGDGETFFRLDSWGKGDAKKRQVHVCVPCAEELGNGVRVNAGDVDAEAAESVETTAEEGGADDDG